MGMSTMIALRKTPRLTAAISAPIKKGTKGGISIIHMVTA